MEEPTQKGIELEAKRIREEYAYMRVDMPLGGWIWEFIRRSDKYRVFHNRALELRSAFMNSTHVVKDTWDRMAEFLSEGLEYFEPEFPFNFLTIDHSEATPSKQMKQVDDNLLQEGYVTIWILNIADREWNHISIRNPDKKYSEFHSGSPRLRGTLPYRLLDKRAHRLFIPEGITGMFKSPISRKEPDDADIDAIRIAISNRIQSKDIDSILLKALREELTDPLNFPLKPTKKRDDKWKYYLIIYDLRKQHGESIGHRELSDILFTAYPEIAAGEKVQADDETRKGKIAENYYNAALKLINGEYRKYLYF